MADLERTLAGDPAHVEAHLLLAACLDPLGGGTRATAVLDRAIELVIAAPLLMTQESASPWEADERPACVPRQKCFGLAVEPGGAGETSVRREALDQDLALATLAREAAERPTFADRRCRLGARLLESGRLSEALEHLDLALTINPRYLEAALLAARARLERGETAEATRLLEPLLHQQPDYPDLHFWLGFARFRARTFALAADALERAAALHRQFARAHGLLGLAHHALGRRDEALRAIRRGLIGGRGVLGAAVEPALGAVVDAAAWWSMERVHRRAEHDHDSEAGFERTLDAERVRATSRGRQITRGGLVLARGGAA